MLCTSWRSRFDRTYLMYEEIKVMKFVACPKRQICMFSSQVQAVSFFIVMVSNNALKKLLLSNNSVLLFYLFYYSWYFSINLSLFMKQKTCFRLPFASKWHYVIFFHTHNSICLVYSDSVDRQAIKILNAFKLFKLTIHKQIYVISAIDTLIDNLKITLLLQK